MVLGALAGLAGAGASLGGSLFSAKSSRKAAKKQRDFILMMSSTAHQREVKDLKAAGLNPILSAMGGQGASTGSPGIAQVPDYGKSFDKVGENVSTAVKVKAERRLLDARINVEEKAAAKIETETEILKGQLPQSEFLQTYLRTPEGIDLLKQFQVRTAIPGSAKELAIQLGYGNKDNIGRGAKNLSKQPEIQSLKGLPPQLMEILQRKYYQWKKKATAPRHSIRPSKKSQTQRRRGATGRY